jgi:hypothetical protein
VAVAQRGSPLPTAASRGVRVLFREQAKHRAVILFESPHCEPSRAERKASCVRILACNSRAVGLPRVRNRGRFARHRFAASPHQIFFRLGITTPRHRNQRKHANQKSKKQTPFYSPCCFSGGVLWKKNGNCSNRSGIAPLTKLD